MLNADDPETIIALRRLSAVAQAGTRPLVFWIGAGSSRWLGYPSWKDLTLNLRRVFFMAVGAFDNPRAVSLIDNRDFPAVFQMCKGLDPHTYFRFIADAFGPRPDSELYKEFLNLLKKLSPLFVLTTNVDEAMESRMPDSSTIQHTDLARCIDLLQKRIPFVAKLHGSVSSVRSTIFATDDYDLLIEDSQYLAALKYIFTGCTVIFLGYGVRDSYVIELLKQNSDEMDLFGAGPHFAVTNDPVPISSLHRIQYSIKHHPDHRAALTVLNYIAQSEEQKSLTPTVAPKKDLKDLKDAEDQHRGISYRGKTAYYISDLVPPGTWGTSEEITAQRESGEIEASFGLGFTNEEIPYRTSTALHDVVVGLICFDYVYLPFSALAPAHNLVGSEVFWELVRTDALRFIHNEAKVGVLFPKGEPIGDLANFIGGTRQGPKPPPLATLIRAALAPAPGKESEARQLFELLERRTAVYRRSQEMNLPALVRSALLMPAVSRLLGIGDSILPTQAPRWLRYPYLRLAHLVQTSVLCTEYQIQAAKVPFGGVQLTTAGFGVQPTEWQADHLASYVSSGSYNSDLGGLILQEMSVLQRILHFRNSAAGESFRRAIGQVLSEQSGGAFSASVNAGLKETIPPNILQQAQDQFLRLMTESVRVTPVPAVWGDIRQSDTTTRLWRAKSQRMLLEMCTARGIGKNDRCICGSGEKLRLCCLPPLRD